MLLADAFGDFAFNSFLTLICLVGFIGGLVKRLDKGGAIKSSAKNAALRGVSGLIKNSFKR